MTATDHAQQIQLLADHFRPYGWTPRSVDGYLISLGDLDLDLVRRAVVEAIRTHDKMPAGAEIRRIALRAVAGEPPDVDDAWAEVLRAAGTHGRLRTPTWRHPLIAQAVESAGGWGHICTTKDLTGARIGFTRAYQTHRDRAERQALTSKGFAAAAQLVADTTRLPALPRPPEVR